MMSIASLSRLVRLAGAAALVGFLTACAHPISLEPKQVPERAESALTAKKVGYLISEADRSKEVTSPGGGGDKVSYFPYRDMERAVRSALRSVYSDVEAVKSAAEAKTSGTQWLFTPVISTTSSSPSPFTWPPTRFGVDINCTVTDAAGNVVTIVQASGSGAAEFDEFKSDFSLSARRAVEDAVNKLVAAIRSNEKLR